jgi:hypothetical protein
MPDERFSISKDGQIVTNEKTGETYAHPFTFERVRYWADDAALKSRWISIYGSHTKLRLSVKKMVIVEARLPNDAAELEAAGSTGVPFGKAVSESQIDGGDRASAGETRVVFESRIYRLDAAAIEARAVLLPPPDGRYFALYIAPGGRVMMSAALRPAPEKFGFAFLENKPTDPGNPAEVVRVSASGSAGSAGAAAPLEVAGTVVDVSAMDQKRFLAMTGDKGSHVQEIGPRIVNPIGPGAVILRGEQPAGLDVAPLDAAELGDLLTEDPLALEAKTAGGVVINNPINFLTFGTVSTDEADLGRLITHPCRGILLARFRVPDWFGTPNEDEDDEGTVRRERFAYYLLTTAAGTVASTRDKKGIVLKAGSIVWVDEKFDLKTFIRYVPRVVDGRPVRASEVLITPRGKVPFVKAGQTRSSWRIEARWLRNFDSPEHLAKIAAMAANCPEIPNRPEDAIDDEDNDPSY